MGYEVKQYKLTSGDVEAINASRPPNWFPRVKVGDEHPMILMGKVLLDGEYFHWVDPNAVEPPAPTVAAAPAPVTASTPVASPSVVPVAPLAVSAPVQVTPVAPVQVPVAPGAISLTPEQHAALQQLGIPATSVK